MENCSASRSRRNISFSYLYNGNTHKFQKPLTSANSHDFSNDMPFNKKSLLRNFFNSPVPSRRSDNNSN